MVYTLEEAFLKNGVASKMNVKKMGFWSVFALVVGAQIGTGAFFLPSLLCPFGWTGVASWAVSGTGAVVLACVFGKLSALWPQTGGPHVYIERLWGRSWGYLVAWTYWMVSWISSVVLVAGVVSALESAFGGPWTLFRKLAVESAVLGGVVALNLRSVQAAGAAETVLLLFKIFPIVVLPLWALAAGRCDFAQHAPHFGPFDPSALMRAALLGFWGFVGLEMATAPSDSVENPRRTVPLALVTGTLFVALVYALNSVIMLGAFSKEQFQTHGGLALYGTLMESMVGPMGEKALAICIAWVCFGSLNAWVLGAAQVSLGAAEHGFFPNFFKRKNASGAPVWGVVLQGMLLGVLLVLCAGKNAWQTIESIVDLSVPLFFFIYGLCALALAHHGIKTHATKSVALGLCGFAFASLSWTQADGQALACMVAVPLAGLVVKRWWMPKNS